MKSLPITLWACVISDDAEYYARTVRVLRYCQRLFRFEHTLLFSTTFDLTKGGIQTIQIPPLTRDTFNVWVNKTMPRFIDSEFAMSVHEDGFILDPARWRDDFLKWDYIGSPWKDGVVGNGGFCLESKKMLREKLDLPFSQPLKVPYDGYNYLPSDVFVCREHRKTLEERGVKFAPLDVAMAFAVEQRGKNWPAFGFHGRNAVPHLYRAAWQKLEESEK